MVAMNRKCVPTDVILSQEVLSLNKASRMESLGRSDSWLHRFRNRLKNRNIAAEIASDEEEVSTFLAELRNCLRRMGNV